MFLKFLTKINCQSHKQRLSYVYALNIVFVCSGSCPSMVLRLCKCHYPLNGFILIICINMFFILQRTNIRIHDVSLLLQIHITNRLNKFCSNGTVVCNYLKPITPHYYASWLCDLIFLPNRKKTPKNVLNHPYW